MTMAILKSLGVYTGNSAILGEAGKFAARPEASRFERTQEAH